MPTKKTIASAVLVVHGLHAFLVLNSTITRIHDVIICEKRFRSFYNVIVQYLNDCDLSDWSARLFD